MVPHQHESHASRLLQETQLLKYLHTEVVSLINNYQTFCPRETAANGTYQRALVAWCFIDTQRLRQFGDAFKDAGAGGRSGNHPDIIVTQAIFPRSLCFTHAGITADNADAGHLAGITQRCPDLTGGLGLNELRRFREFRSVLLLFNPAGKRTFDTLVIANIFFIHEAAKGTG